MDDEYCSEVSVAGCEGIFTYSYTEGGQQQASHFRHSTSYLPDAETTKK